MPLDLSPTPRPQDRDRAELFEYRLVIGAAVHGRPPAKAPFEQSNHWYGADRALLVELGQLTHKGLQVVLVNPATTKRNKENRDNCQSKSDPKDALVIADVVSRGFYYEHTKQTHVFQRLRTLMSDREFWVINSVRL